MIPSVLHSFSLINESTVVTDDEASSIARSLQRQVNRDYRPIWGTNAEVHAVPRGSTPPAGDWWLVILDDMDQAGALGYHDLTDEGLPIGKVGAKTDLKYGALVSVTCSHELLEMLGDPRINLIAEDWSTGREYAYENCDAVEADQFSYEVLGNHMSDFVFPEYFDPSFKGKGKLLSFRGNVTTPFQLAAGGYLSYKEPGSTRWEQVTADSTGRGARPEGFPPGTRRERRTRVGQLQCSTPRRCG